MSSALTDAIRLRVPVCEISAAAWRITPRDSIGRWWRDDAQPAKLCVLQVAEMTKAA
jgi:hypothetical protein